MTQSQSFYNKQLPQLVVGCVVHMYADDTVTYTKEEAAHKLSETQEADGGAGG